MKRFLLHIASIGIAFCISTACGEKSEKLARTNKEKTPDFTPKFNEVDKSFISKKRKEIYPFYNEILGNKRFNGMFLVAKNGKIIFEKVNGYLDYQEDKKLAPHTPIHLASISKVATAMATMRLVDQGKISLEDDVRKYLPILPYKGVTVRMLLNHRSGIPYYGYFSEGHWDKGKMMRNNDVLKLLNKYHFPLNFPSGKRFAYCNTNYALLALIIEKVSNQDFPTAMKTLVFDPLQMNNSIIVSKGPWPQAYDQV